MHAVECRLPHFLRLDYFAFISFLFLSFLYPTRLLPMYHWPSSTCFRSLRLHPRGAASYDSA